MCIRACRESGDLLVPDMQPFDAAVAANGIGNAIEAVADKTVNPLDAGSGQYFDKLICNGLGHVCPLRTRHEKRRA